MNLWGALLDIIEVYSDGRIVAKFKCGFKEEWGNNETRGKGAPGFLHVFIFKCNILMRICV